jgi:signal transduction histidine kinase
MTEKGFSTTPNSIVMPNSDHDSAASAVLEALGFAVFIRDKSGALRLDGKSPEWLRSIWPGLNAADALLPIDQASPFLENFLIDAGECWSVGAENRARSGPWVERAADGTELTMEATAFTAGGQSILLLERLGEVFEEKKSMLQHARQTMIAYQRLDSEMQKKEILLSCISEEMNAALANVITSLRLIELEKNPAHLAPLLSLAARATEEQQTLINKVLNVFATELEGLYGFDASANANAKLNDAVRAAEENVAPRFAERRVRLNIADGVSDESGVAMDAQHLARVLSSLFENGLQNVSAAGEVQLQVIEEPDSFLIQVLDNGAPLPRDVCEDLFSRIGPTTSRLPLQFCRIAVANCHGEIGYEPRDEGGNCFWIRLPKPASTK